MAVALVNGWYVKKRVNGNEYESSSLVEGLS